MKTVFLCLPIPSLFYAPPARIYLAGTHRVMGQWVVFISEFSASHILQPKLASNFGGVSGGPPCSWLESEWDAGLSDSPSFHSKVGVTFEISNVISHTALTENTEEASGWEEGSGVISLLGQSQYPRVLFPFTFSDGLSYVREAPSGPPQEFFSWCTVVKNNKKKDDHL